MDKAALKAWRDRLGLPQAAMARYVRVPVGTWVKWERGDREPPAVARSLFEILHMMEETNPAAHKLKVIKAKGGE